MRRWWLGASLLLAGCATVPTPVAYAPIDEAEMRALIAPLASDAFEGRMPGTRGEQMTVEFLAARLKQVGVAPGMADGSYEQRFAIPSQKKPIPKDGPGMPDGQIGFMQAMNAQGDTSSRNVIGVVRGAKPDGRAVVLMAHWDHLGLCRPADPVDRICNGAVDNGSGTAALLAVAARVARMKLDRDVWFVFTGAEEWGLLGALFVLVIFGLILRWGWRVAQNAPDRFSRLLAAGMTCTVFFYVAINLLMVVGLAPVVGIPLPFMSHGGSSMMTNMICLGTIMAVDRWSRRSSGIAG